MDHLDSSNDEEDKPLVSKSTPSQPGPLAIPNALLEEYTGPINAGTVEQMKKLKARFEAHEERFNVPPTATTKGFGPNIFGEIVLFLLNMFELVVYRERTVAHIVPLDTTAETSARPVVLVGTIANSSCKLVELNQQY